MFLNLKTKLYFFSTKKKIIAILFISILLIAVIAAFILIGSDTNNKKAVQPTMDQVEKEKDRVLEDTEEVIYGKNIKDKYMEVKGTDYAILVATIDFLKGNGRNESDKLYKYILENNDTNMISVIKDADGNSMDAVFVNYNRLLKDKVVTKDISGGFITPYGFTGKGETKFNKYNENKSIEIKDDAVFSEHPIYDGDYKQIGVLYIEMNN